MFRRRPSGNLLELLDPWLARGHRGAGGPEVGPGSYDQYEKTLAEDCDMAIARSSRVKPGFGTTTPQRKLPFYAQGTPAPGCYEPMEPRLKDLSGEDRRNVM